MAKKSDPPAPDPMQRPPRWKVPPECANCGARVDQALQSRMDRPACKFCAEPLPCEALPPPAPAPTGFEAMMGGIVNSAMAGAMAQQQQMAEQWMQNLQQPGALAAMNDPYVHGRGTIKGFQDLGQETPEGRLYLVTVEVRLAGGNPYQATVSSPVPQDCWGKLAPEVEVAVRVIMSNREAPKIDWRSP